MKCFYHAADLDGHCSGAIVKMACPEAELIGINYGDSFPWADIEEGEEIVMVDFALQPYDPDMVRLLTQYNVTWIDHHKSALEALQEYNARGIQRGGLGACGLCWEYYFREKPCPTSVKLLAEYDVWNHTDPRTLPFQYGMRQNANTLPDNMNFWLRLFDVEEIHHICEVGTIIMNYQALEDKKYCDSCAFETMVNGLRCIAINKMMTNSQVFDSIQDNGKYHAMLTFGWRKEKWTVSLYSDREDVDVSETAKIYGGGGHKGAAGFQCQELPFPLRRKIE